MSNYTPFLKVKMNEITAIGQLPIDLRTAVIPFFDLPTKPTMTPDSFKRMVGKGAKAMEKHLGDVPAFFLDNFDIDDTMLVDGIDNYQFVVDTFQELPFIPVVGLDRSGSHNDVVFNGKSGGTIASDEVALRLQAEDFASFALVEPDLDHIFAQGSMFSQWTVILDNRVCLDLDANRRATELVNFITAIRTAYDLKRIVVVGSSIPPSIGQIIGVGSELVQDRIELAIFTSITGALGDEDVDLGDYTVVSPLYSDADIPPGVMLNVMAPRVIYSYNTAHFLARGGALRTHPRGNMQYNDIAINIVGRPFYRGSPYSFGDNFLNDKANFVGSQVTPGSILKPTINAHVTYMARTFGLP